MKLVNREKGTSPALHLRLSGTDQEWEPAWQRQGAAESVAPPGWQHFIKPRLLQKGKLAVLVLLPAPPKICCLRPNRDIGTRDSWAVRDAANPDLSRWTCERLQLSIGWVEEEKSVLSVLSCCRQGVRKISEYTTCSTFCALWGCCPQVPAWWGETHKNSWLAL